MATLKFKNGEFYVGKEKIDGIYAFNINEDFEKRRNPDLYITIKARVPGIDFNDIEKG